jgi:phosphoglycerate dehydrogenase-like enzyme
VSGLIALIPNFVAPQGDDVVGYGADDVLSADLLDRCGLFVPHYMGPEPNAHLMQQMPNLQACQLLTAGYDSVVPFVPKGVSLSNAAGVHDAGTSELAVALILAVLRGIDTAARAMTTATWVHETHESLADRRVLVIGAGGVGRAIERRLAAFEVHVTLMGRTRRSGIAGVDELPEQLSAAEIVVIAVPLTEQTQGLVDAAFIDRMRTGALLVNVSRGPVVVTDDLVAALQAGRIRAALDVTDPEPLPPGHPLWSCPNLLITGHLGGDTTSFPPSARRLLVEQVERWRAGLELLHQVHVP